MKILHIVHGFPPLERSGVEEHAYQVAKAEVKAGNEVYVFCRSSMDGGPEYFVKQEILDGISVTRVNTTFIKSLHDAFVLDEPEINAIFDKFVGKVSPDIVHIHHLMGLSVGIVEIIKKYNIPYAITLHDFWYLCPRVFLWRENGELCFGPDGGKSCLQFCPGRGGAPRKFLAYFRPVFKIWRRLPSFLKIFLWHKNSLVKKIFLQKTGSGNKDRYRLRLERTLAVIGHSGLVIAPSEFVKNRYVGSGVREDKITIVPHALGKDLFSGFTRKTDRRRVVFGFVGSLAEHKGAHVLLGAFSRLKNDNYRLYIYGDESYDELYIRRLKSVVRKDARIKLMGGFEHKNIREVLKNLDVLVVPSVCQESFGYAAHEALYAGLPVIASDLEVFKEVIRDGENGYLFKRNNADDLSEKIQAVVHRENLFKKDAGAVKTLDIKDYSDMVLGLYKTKFHL